jgi:hypothetical protein
VPVAGGIDAHCAIVVAADFAVFERYFNPWEFCFNTFRNPNA